MEIDPNIPLIADKLQLMVDVEEEAHSRGMKEINIWPDHVLIELQNKIIKVFYNGKIHTQHIQPKVNE